MGILLLTSLLEDRGPWVIFCFEVDSSLPGRWSLLGLGGHVSLGEPRPQSRFRVDKGMVPTRNWGLRRLFLVLNHGSRWTISIAIGFDYDSGSFG